MGKSPIENEILRQVCYINQKKGAKTKNMSASPLAIHFTCTWMAGSRTAAENRY